MLQVEICIEGCLDQHWSEWFEGFEITHTNQGETVLTGTVKDEAAMYGLVTKLRDLGLQLLSINRGDKPFEIHKN